MIASLLLLSTLKITQVPPSIKEAKLELEVPGATLSTLAKEVESQTGWKVKVHPEVANDVVVVYSNGKNAEETIKQLGKATATQWVLNGGELSIVPDVTLRKRQEQIEQEEYVKQIADNRKGYLSKEWDLQSASTRIELSLVRQISVETLAGIKPGERVVFSSHPTRMQRPIGQFDSRDVEEWVADHNKIVKEINEENIEDNEGRDLEWEKYIYGPGPQEVKEAPSKLLLVAERDLSGSEVDLGVKLVGRTGKTLVESSIFLTGKSFPFRMGLEDEYDEIKPLPQDKLKIKLSDETVDIVKAWSLDLESETLPNPHPKKVREMMLRPDLFEPMRFEVGEALLLSAKAMEKPLVAVLPDFCANLTYDSLPETVRDVREGLSYYEVSESELEGWWLVLPQNPPAARSNRIDREVLAALLVAIDGKLATPLDPIADFVYAAPHTSENEVSIMYLMHRAPHIFSNIFMEQSLVDEVRLYGSLNTAERKNLRAGQPLQISQMTQSTRALLEEYVYGLELKAREINPQILHEPFSIVKACEEAYDYGDSAIKEEIEPTELFPNGLPPAGYLNMSSLRGQYLLPVSSDGARSQVSMPFGRMELSLWKMLYQNPGFSQELGAFGAVLQNMRMGYWTELKFALFLTPQIGFSGYLVDMEEPDMAQKYSIENLPPEQEAQALKDAEELRNSLFGRVMNNVMGGGAGGRTIRP